MNFLQKNNIQFLLKIIFVVIFIPMVIVVLFVFVPIIISIVCVVLLLMYFTGRKLNRNASFFNIGGNPFSKRKTKAGEKSKDTEYYDAEYISIDNEKK